MPFFPHWWKYNPTPNNPAQPITIHTMNQELREKQILRGGGQGWGWKEKEKGLQVIPRLQGQGRPWTWQFSHCWPSDGTIGLFGGCSDW